MLRLTPPILPHSIIAENWSAKVKIFGCPEHFLVHAFLYIPVTETAYFRISEMNILTVKIMKTRAENLLRVFY